MNFGRLFNPYGAYGVSRTLKSGINWSGILGNTQKTLGIINQAIPVFYQIRPMFNNIKTMFRVANEINKDDNVVNNNNSNNNIQSSEHINKEKKQVKYEQANYSMNEGPNFFI